MRKNPFELFDTILEALSREFLSAWNFKDLQNYCNEKLIFKGEKASEKLKTERLITNLTLIIALEFLKNENLVDFDEQISVVNITTKGFIKIKTKGFQEELKEAKWNLWIESFNKLATPLIAIFALVVSFLTFISKT